jgi:hypothetical protein
MNKFMAILLGMGALGAFGLSQRDSFTTQQVSRYGNPIGEAHILENSRVQKVGYFAVGVIFMTGSFYFISKVRNDDLRRK